MLRWLARHRFNYMDVSGLYLFVSFANKGNIWWGLALWFCLFNISHHVERMAKDQDE